MTGTNALLLAIFFALVGRNSRERAKESASGSTRGLPFGEPPLTDWQIAKRGLWAMGIVAAIGLLGVLAGLR